MSTQFGDKYRRWARVTKATMRITHKPGDAMPVDFRSGLSEEQRNAALLLFKNQGCIGKISE